MDPNPIPDRDPSNVSAVPVGAKASVTGEAISAAGPVREGLRFPGEDGGKSLSQMAQRDLDATLQLLVERAQYITGASAAAIAMRQGETEAMICCASAGPAAPEQGVQLQLDSGLSGESVRLRKTLRCDDASTDSRVNRETCKAHGVISTVVMPLVREGKVYGVFELLSSQPHAFGERDEIALERLAEMIHTAVDHATAARRAEEELGLGPPPPAPAESVSLPGAAEVGGESAGFARTVDKRGAQSLPALAHPPLVTADSTLADVLDTAARRSSRPGEADSSHAIQFGNVGRCQECGFPVSEGRRLCLDCEAVAPSLDPAGGEPPSFYDTSGAGSSSWLRDNAYLVAAVLVTIATIVVVVWRH